MPPTFAKATARLATSLGMTIIRKTERGSVAPLFRLEECSPVNGEAGDQGEDRPREFVTTRWSLILWHAAIQLRTHRTSLRIFL